MYHIGSAMSLWQLVESELGHIFCTLVGPFTAANAVYNSVMNLNIRLDMVNAALQARVTDADILAEWGTLCRSIKTKSEKRNKIAHFTVIIDSRKNGEAVLVPNPIRIEEFLRSINGKGSKHGWKDVELFGEAFNDLRHALQVFCHRLSSSL